MTDALMRYSPLHGGESATAELLRLKTQCEGYDPVPIYRKLLRQSGRKPDQIVRWVRETILHIDGCPAVMQEKDGERPFLPLETVLSGVGQCTGAAELAAALIETAGNQVRLWAVPGHTFVEWRTKVGRWQLEDVDIFPADVPLPRGLSMRSLLESFPDWIPLLDALPTMNSIAASHCFVPTGGGELHCWHRFLRQPMLQETHAIFDVGSLERQLRTLRFQEAIANEEPCIVVDNPNPKDLIAVICNKPFEDEIVELDNIQRQHDVFRFARARNYYTEHFSQTGRKIYARVPGCAKGFRIPLVGMDAKNVSVFTLSTDNVWSEPYLVKRSIALGVPTNGLGKDIGSSVKSPAALVKAQTIFQKLSEDGLDVVTKAAASHASGNDPKKAFDAVTQLNLPRFEGRVLDAGCGTGAYALVLAQQADSVTAIDFAVERVQFLEEVLERLSPRPKIEASVGKLEELPYGDGEFDNIFCRGAIANMTRSLNEFHRVLKSRGHIYLNCNADAWNQYLMLDHGKSDPDTIRQERDTLYNTAWRRFGVPAMGVLTQSIDKHGLALSDQSDRLSLDELLDEMDRHLRQMTPEDAATVRRLELNARKACGEGKIQAILADMLANASGKQFGPTVSVTAQAWQPEEVREIVLSLGFTDFIWWSEAGSQMTAGLRPLEIAPMIETQATAPKHFRGMLSLWHCLFKKA